MQGLCQAHLRDHPLEAGRQLNNIDDPFFEAERHVVLRLQRDLLGGEEALDHLKDYMPHILQVRYTTQLYSAELQGILHIGRPCLVNFLIFVG